MSDCCAVCQSPLYSTDRIVFEQASGLMFCSDHGDCAHGREPDEFSWGPTPEDEALIAQLKRYDDSARMGLQRMVDELKTLDRMLALPVPEPIGRVA